VRSLTPDKALSPTLSQRERERKLKSMQREGTDLTFSV
jgi:hypothetical protein